MRIGIGYDIHRLKKGRALMLGGVNIPHPKGLVGYSDGDSLLHAICDAILGALGKGDIGTHFPDTNPKYKDISSIRLLKDVRELMNDEGYKIHNLDCVVIAEKPKISAHRKSMINVIAGVLKTSKNSVNVKGKTNEGLGDIGEGKAIAAHAVVLLKRNR